MESLADQLTRQLEISRSRRTDEENRLVDAAIRELAESARALSSGETAPDFALPNQLGEQVSEAEARARGVCAETAISRAPAERIWGKIDW